VLPGAAPAGCVSFADEPEIELPNGDVTVGVVRIGDTVRRPRQETSDGVADYLRHLQAVGFDRAPRHLGVDARGRDVLSFLEGDVPGDPIETWAASDAVLPGVARLARALHDASAGFVPARPMRPVVAGRPLPSRPARRGWSPSATSLRRTRCFAPARPGG
jgi:hypothetical protein